MKPAKAFQFDFFARAEVNIACSYREFVKGRGDQDFIRTSKAADSGRGYHRLAVEVAGVFDRFAGVKADRDPNRRRGLPRW